MTLAAIGGTSWSSFAQTSSTLSKDSSSTSPANGAHFSFGLEGVRTVPGQAKAILGASFRYELHIASYTLLTATVGYSFLSGRDQESPKSLWHRPVGASFLPVKVGVKHYLDNHFFVEGQAGAAILRMSGQLWMIQLAFSLFYYLLVCELL